MRVLVNGKEIERAQQEFMKLVSSNAPKHVMHVGDPGGHRENALVYWIGSVDLWANFEKPLEPGERYWNLFGLGKPDSVARTMCEINLPLRSLPGIQYCHYLDLKRSIENVSHGRALSG